MSKNLPQKKWSSDLTIQSVFNIISCRSAKSLIGHNSIHSKLLTNLKLIEELINWQLNLSYSSIYLNGDQFIRAGCRMMTMMTHEVAVHVRHGVSYLCIKLKLVYV